MLTGTIEFSIDMPLLLISSSAAGVGILALVLFLVYPVRNLPVDG